LLVGSKANPSNGTPEGTGATLRPIGAAVLQQYNDESAFAAIPSHISCSFVTGTSTFDVTVVVEYTISRSSFVVSDAWLVSE
jgi:hypothetical protein